MAVIPPLFSIVNKRFEIFRGFLAQELSHWLRWTDKRGRLCVDLRLVSLGFNVSVRNAN